MRHVNPFEAFVGARVARRDGEQWLDGRPVAADGRAAPARRLVHPRWWAVAAVLSLLVGVGVS